MILTDISLSNMIPVQFTDNTRQICWNTILPPPTPSPILLTPFPPPPLSPPLLTSQLARASSSVVWHSTLKECEVVNL